MAPSTDNSQPISRRRFLKYTLTGVGVAGVGAGISLWQTRNTVGQKPQRDTRVAIFKANSYSGELAGIIRNGLGNFPDVVARAKGRRVLLKPNLVEFSKEGSINTNPAVIAAAIEAFRSVGAREVIVAEGPGHQRDTEMLIEESGLQAALRHERTSFVDLNIDSTHPVALEADYTRLGRLFLPDTVLGADLVVSLPKMKTHHWVGVTLAMKNFFGVVPGVKYGWPKNLLHWRGIPQSIVDINLAVKPGFAIVDGIEGMEGDGPLRGETVKSGVLLMGDNLTAVDATAVRVMGLRPEKVGYLLAMTEHGGTLKEKNIQQIGETIVSVRRPFRVLDDFAKLRQA